MNEIYDIDYEMEWYDRLELSSLINIEKSQEEFNIKSSSLFTDMIYFLQDRGILVYNILKVNNFSKSLGNILITIDAECINDELLELEKYDIEDQLIDKFRRLTSITFERLPGIWVIELEEANL